MADADDFIDLAAEESVESEERVPPTPASTADSPDRAFACGMCGVDMLGCRMAAGMCGHVFCAECLHLRAECPTCMARLTQRIELIFD